MATENNFGRIALGSLCVALVGALVILFGDYIGVPTPHGPSVASLIDGSSSTIQR